MRISPWIFIIGMVFAVAAGCLMYETPENEPKDVLPIEPLVEDKVYEQGYTGEVTGTVKYQVMVVDNLDTQFICDALQYVPGWIEFEIIAPDSSQYAIEQKGDLAGMHVPQRNNLIIVFDGDNYPNMKACGCSYFTVSDGSVSHRLGIAVYDTDTRVTVGMRIFHEALHGVERGGEADDMNCNKMYDGYQGAAVFEQYEYYGFLMTKYRGDLDG